MVDVEVGGGDGVRLVCILWAGAGWGSGSSEGAGSGNRGGVAMEWERLMQKGGRVGGRASKCVRAQLEKKIYI